MADSDDEYDRRRRDKFRRERSDYDRSREREERRRDDWSDREWDRGRERRSRGEYRDYDRSRRERFSPPRHELSPPQKRMRRDWDDHGGDPYHSGYDMPYSGAGGGPAYGPPQPWAHPEMHTMQHHSIPIQARLGNLHDVDLGSPAPVMKTFKEFLLSLEDSVDETEAVRRYNDYKMEFRRQQMQEFFLAHKDEEWFRSKYHPDEVGRHKQECQAALRTRLGAFMYLMENNWLNDIQLDMDKAPAIIKVLDAAVIKMEGGTEIDLKILDEEEEQARREAAKKEAARRSEGDKKAAEEKEAAPKAEKEEAAEEKPPKPSDEEGKAEEADGDKRKSSKRKRKHSGDSDVSDSESGSESGSLKPEPPGQNGREEGTPKKKEKEEDGEKPKEKQKEEVVKPRPLHKTLSLFMRSIAPNISKAEIASVFKKYSGFLRVALSDPQPERRFLRRCWVTFDRSVNIKEICWNLQNIRLRECELSPGVNRELSWRVRNISGLTQHRTVQRNDIKLAAKLIHVLDERGQLWSRAEEGQEGNGQNPILKNITDYLIDEVNAEEEELLWGTGRTPESEPPKEGNPAEIVVERDEKLIKVLDKLLLYLRIVHSVDYYNTCEYPSEDEMPTRCGIMHVRGPVPPNRVSHGEVAEWQKTFEEKLAPLFAAREMLSEEEAVKMGKKDPEQELEKFVVANTQELGKEKWLCPLSGKKFKGPEFVRKHIFNKHAEKIEEVKKEVLFFNNYLMDSKRPALPEVKPVQPPVNSTAQALAPGLLYPHQGHQSLLQYGQPRLPVLGYGGPQFPPAPYGAGRGAYDAFRGQGGLYPGKPRNRMIRGDPRAIIEYRDLDAPEDVDFF
ncbi:serrate RNA effector molecule homolog [Spea bombifrons]|uniref:serrate RNA effector molecule homolog n=1 Tax=Spea bombifrons TaxID=233779 RepID=UPI00234AF5A0|nr:serrate RNA effector molecule homolog [Spea bombifrons]